MAILYLYTVLLYRFQIQKFTERVGVHRFTVLCVLVTGYGRPKTAAWSVTCSAAAGPEGSELSVPLAGAVAGAAAGLAGSAGHGDHAEQRG
jgi:hypothetical protein